MPNANIIIEKQLDARLVTLQNQMGGDAIAFIGPIVYGVEEELKNSIEAIKKKRKKLIVILETSGGYIEVVQRMVDTMRHNYKLVEFIIPNYAMSAGTVLAMSGDEIYMDYFSILGPIDPQVEKEKRFIPALGYLIQYERLLEKSRKGTLTLAELNYLVEKFDPAELYHYEQSRQLSITLLKEWLAKLAKYKFKNWKVTERRGIRVTKQMKADRAAKIATQLNNTDFWHSHGRGISMEVLRRKLKLLIHDFGDNIDLRNAIKAYHKLITDYMYKRDYGAVIHSLNDVKPLSVRR